MVHTIRDLNPYTYYEFHVKACTDVDCGVSESIIVRTLEDVPSNQPPPSIESTSTTWIAVSWQHPAQNNGIITR